MSSEATNELASALAKAQLEFSPIRKGRTAKIFSPKGNYTYQYADLADVISATTPALSKHGLVISQPVELRVQEGTVTTLLLHSSGQWLGSTCSFLVGDRMQETGSRITYLRRYALSGMLGVASEDDTDGDEDSPPPAPEKRSHEPHVAPSAALSTAPHVVPVPKTKVSPAPVVTRPTATSSAESNRMKVLQAAAKHNWVPASVTEFIQAAYGVSLVRDLTSEQVEYVIKLIEAKSSAEAIATVSQPKPDDTSFDFGANASQRIGTP